MRKAAWVAALWLAASPAARSGEDPGVKAALDRAVKAMGGAKTLAGVGGLTWKVAGTVDFKGVKADLAGDWSVQGSDKYRWDVTLTAMGRPVQASIVVNGDKAWAIDANGRSSDAPNDFAPVLKADFNCLRLVQNPLLLRERGVTLAPLGELKVNDRDTVGVKVRRKGRPDVDLFFDKKTGLPYKTEVRVKEGKDGEEAVHAFVFDNYKEFGAIRHFTKVSFLRDNTSVVELECSDVSPQEKVDDSLFTRPAKNK